MVGGIGSMECKYTQCQFNYRWGKQFLCRLSYLVRDDICPYKQKVKKKKVKKNAT